MARMQFKLKSQRGFTLMEIVVATVIFAVVVTSLLSLFNYVLKINRKSEALRQASQGMRNFVEGMVKEIRNGQLDYGFIDPGGVATSSPPSACSSLTNVGYSVPEDNRLAVLGVDGNENCFFFGDSSGSYMNSSTFVCPGNQNCTLVQAQTGLSQNQILNPPNFRVDSLRFLVRPSLDPYTPGNIKYQPMVTVLAKFVVALPTGEQVPISYQTSISTNKYDIPNSP